MKIFHCNKLDIDLEVYETGEIFYNGKKLSQYNDSNGYPYVQPCVNYKRRSHKIHILLATCFIDNPDNKLCVNHIDGDKKNYNLSNLEWCTHSENMKHAVKIGLVTNCTQKGEKHNTSKYSNATIQAIKADYNIIGNSMRKVAKKYGCSLGFVSDVVNGKIRF